MEGIQHAGLEAQPLLWKRSENAGGEKECRLDSWSCELFGSGVADHSPSLSVSGLGDGGGENPHLGAMSRNAVGEHCG